MPSVTGVDIDPETGAYLAIDRELDAPVPASSATDVETLGVTDDAITFSHRVQRRLDRPVARLATQTKLDTVDGFTVEISDLLAALQTVQFRCLRRAEATRHIGEGSRIRAQPVAEPEFWCDVEEAVGAAFRA